MEITLRAIMSEDLQLTVDNLLLDAVAADSTRPAGLRYGVAGLTPSATTGSSLDKMIDDVEVMLDAIKPAVKPVMIIAVPQAAAVGYVTSWLPMIRAPYLPTGTAIMVDAAAFVSALGSIDTTASEQPTLHMSDTPLAIASGSQGSATLAAPSSSTWQQGLLALRSILDINWALRRTGSVSWMTGITGW
jgi:hypothetical protein